MFPCDQHVPQLLPLSQILVEEHSWEGRLPDFLPQSKPISMILCGPSVGMITLTSLKGLYEAREVPFPPLPIE